MNDSKLTATSHRPSDLTVEIPAPPPPTPKPGDMLQGASPAELSPVGGADETIDPSLVPS